MVNVCFLFRVILDRAGPQMDDFWASLDFTIHDNCKVKPLVAEDQNPPVFDKLPKDIDSPIDPIDTRSVKSPVDDKLLLQASDSVLDW